jgi:hypothetical protein
MTTTEEAVCNIIHTGLSRLVKETDAMWPGTDRQLPERNLSLYVAHELLGRGYTVMAEWPLNKNEHIDLVAYDPEARVLVLLESKRAWNRALELGWLRNDIERLERAASSLDAWTLGASEQWQQIEPQTVIGVVLVGSIDGRALDPERYRRGKIGDVIRDLIDKVGPFARISHRDRENPYVLHYAAWRISQDARVMA